MNSTKKIMNYVLNFLIVSTSFLLFFNVFLDIQTSLLHRSYKSFFGFSIFEIKTGSMGKAIAMGDWILVKNTKKVDLNDIVTYEENGNFITHRVVQKYKDSFVTKGDANNRADSPISQEQIVGKVVRVLPKLGIIRMVFLNIQVLIPAIVTLIILCLIFDGDSDGKESLVGMVLSFVRSRYGPAPYSVVIPRHKSFGQNKNVDDNLSMTCVLSRIDVPNDNEIFSSHDHDEKDLDDEII